MQYLGHPIIGDFLYNPDMTLIHRQALHSCRLEFSHPITESPCFLPLPCLKICGRRCSEMQKPAGRSCRAYLHIFRHFGENALLLFFTAAGLPIGKSGIRSGHGSVLGLGSGLEMGSGLTSAQGQEGLTILSAQGAAQPQLLPWPPKELLF